MHRILLLLLFLLSLPAHAGIPPLWKVRNYSVSDGLTQNTVYCIFQDSEGYIWIGTGDGLNLLKGQQIVQWRADRRDSCSLSYNSVRGILEGPDGTLFFGTEKGLSVLKNKSCFHRPAALADVSVIPITVHGNILYLWLQCRGIFGFDTEKEKLIDIDPSFSERCRKQCTGLTDHEPFGKGVWWLSTNHGSFLFSLPEGNAPASVTAADSGNGALVFTDPAGVRWRVDGSGLGVLVGSGTVKLVATLPQVLRNTQIKDLMEADRDHLLLATYGEGLWMIRKKDGKALRVVREAMNFTGKPSSLLMTALRDRSGNIWMGTDGNGAEIFRPAENRFTHIHSIPWTGYDLGSAFCRAFALLNENLMLVSCYNSPLVLFDLEDYLLREVSLEPDKAFSGRKIYAMAAMGRHLLFAAAEGLWEASFSLRKEGISVSGLRKLSAGPARRLSRIGPDGWICNMDRHLLRVRYQESGFSVESVADAWENCLVAPVYGSPGKKILLTINNAVLEASWPARGKPDTSGLFRLPATVNKIFFLQETRNGWLMAGTNDGLYIYRDRKELFRHYSTHNGLPNNYVYAVLTDRSGLLWCSSNGGISRIDPGTGKIRNFGRGSGVQSPEFNTGAYLDIPGGRMVMGGIQGFNLFDPADFTPADKPVPVVLVGATVNEKPLPGALLGLIRGKEFHHSRNNWWFKVDALDYPGPGINRYAFLLQGFDTNWIRTGTNNTMRYLHLRPGKYTLFVRVTGDGGTEGQVTDLFSFRIRKPFYATYWFITTGAVLAIFLIYALSKAWLRNKYMFEIHRLEKERAVQEERLRISRDMHDDIGTGISQIAILSEIAKKTATEPDRNMPVLDRISGVAGELIDNISNIIWVTKPEYDKLESLVYYMREYAGSLFENTRVSLHFTTPGEIPALPLNNQVRRNIFLIFKEVLNNILKHSDAACVSVDIAVCGNELTVVVHDDGKGFLQEDVTRFREGLGNMQRRANDCSGRVEIDSIPGKGTRVRFSCRM